MKMSIRNRIFATSMVIVLMLIMVLTVVGCKDNNTVTYTLSYSNSAGGSIEGNKVQTVESGKNGSEVTAIANVGYKFVGWSDGLSTESRTDKNITGNLAVYAQFSTAITYLVTYSALDDGYINGNNYQRVNINSDASTVTAVPYPGYKFVRWSDGLTIAERTDKNITADLSLTAEFVGEILEVKYSADSNGTITGEAIQTVERGANATTVVATPKTGYEFVGWSDGVTTPERQDKNIQKDIDVIASFTGKVFNVTYIAESNGYIEGFGQQKVSYKENAQSVTAVASDGYKFKHWSDGYPLATREDKRITSDLTLYAEFEEIAFINVKYSIQQDDNYSLGHIIGVQIQKVGYGKSTTPVTAIANAGYMFNGWSDGITTAYRQDVDLTEDLNVTAYFIPAVQTLSYQYNGATSGNTEQQVTFTQGRIRELTLPTPQKTGYNFQGWFLDSEFKYKVANSAGQMLMNDELITMQTGKLYAKWTSEDIIVYPVLMVYVTQTHANFIDGDGEICVVDYNMSQVERQILEVLSTQLSITLNDWMQDIVTFEIDNYFTSVPITEDNCWGIDGDKFMPRAHLMYEVLHFYPNYRTVMLNFGMDDYSFPYKITAGDMAGEKYAYMLLESVFYYVNDKYVSLEIMLEDDYSWISMLRGYIHEFIHTIEAVYYDWGEDFHQAVLDARKQYPNMDYLEIYRLYMRDELILDSGLTGIPRDFWASDINFEK